MEWIHWLIASLFALAGGVCVLLVALQLPGAWFLLALALGIEVADGLWLPGGGDSFGWRALGLALALGLVGEAIEFVAALLGVRRGGGTQRGMVGALLGGLLGFFALTPLFVFVPVFGSLFGALLGTFVGAYVGEATGKERVQGGALRPALWATWGRVLGTTAKLGIALAMWLLLAARLFWSA